uniref:Uncharacterized protein n=1 Tax=Romanomermis culicivorax TaxID=13658 RepID=A0A915HX46_ROMCU
LKGDEISQNEPSTFPKRTLVHPETPNPTPQCSHSSVATVNHNQHYHHNHHHEKSAPQYSLPSRPPMPDRDKFSAAATVIDRRSSSGTTTTTIPNSKLTSTAIKSVGNLVTNLQIGEPDDPADRDKKHSKVIYNKKTTKFMQIYKSKLEKKIYFERWHVVENYNRDKDDFSSSFPSFYDAPLPCKFFANAERMSACRLPNHDQINDSAAEVVVVARSSQNRQLPAVAPRLSVKKIIARLDDDCDLNDQSDKNNNNDGGGNPPENEQNYDTPPPRPKPPVPVKPSSNGVVQRQSSNNEESPSLFGIILLKFIDISDSIYAGTL